MASILLPLAEKHPTRIRVVQRPRVLLPTDEIVVPDFDLEVVLPYQAFRYIIECIDISSESMAGVVYKVRYLRTMSSRNLFIAVFKAAAPVRAREALQENGVLVYAFDEFESYLRRLRETLQVLPPEPVTQEVRGDSSVINQSPKEYDAFVSYATEDGEFVGPLVELLRGKGHKIWYDKFALQVGDSLRRSVDDGLSSCCYGVVILSKHFFAKNWTGYELDGLTSREMDEGKLILPVWLKLEPNTVRAYSPTLADRVALRSPPLTTEQIAEELSRVLRRKGPRVALLPP